VDQQNGGGPREKTGWRMLTGKNQTADVREKKTNYVDVDENLKFVECPRGKIKMADVPGEWRVFTGKY
jgi:hypothetical protein